LALLKMLKHGMCLMSSRFLLEFRHVGDRQVAPVFRWRLWAC
jgi:hypothetical protein